MDIIVTVLSSAAAVLFIVLGAAVQSGAGTTIMHKLDRAFEQRYASRAIIIDADEGHKRRV